MMDQTARVHVRAISALAPGVWDVRLQDGDSTWSKEVKDPAMILGEPSSEDLEWVFGKFSRRHPYESAKAAKIFQSLLLYAQALDGELGLTKHYQSSAHLIPTPPRGVGKIPGVFVDVEDIEDGSLFHGLLWESLECLHRLECVEANCVYIVRRIDHSKEDTSKHEALISAFLHVPMPVRTSVVKRTFNILLAVSRPEEDDDIDPYITCDTIIDLLVNMDPEIGCKFRLEVSRPGTWNAFKKHISSSTETWHSIGGRGPWFDVVHFDAHGVVQDGTACLRFLSGSGMNEYRPTYEEIGKLLRANEVQTVVFNSCDSAKVTSTEESNMAMKLLALGVKNVVAMQFPLTSTAAALFIKNFYSIYLTGSHTLSEAAHLARQVLLGTPTRDSYLGVKVDLPDFVVPAVYRSGTVESSQEVAAVSELPAPPQEFIDTFNARVSVDKEFKSWGPFFGRDYDGMAIEWKFFREKRTHVVLITGTHGCGKTTFSHWLMRRWMLTSVTTGGLAFSYKSRDPGNILLLLRELYDDSQPEYPQPLENFVNLLRSNRFVIHIDSIECLGDPLMSVANGVQGDVNDEDRAHLKNFIGRLQGGSSMVILNSISNEPWLGLPRSSVYLLGALSHYHACSLAQAVYQAEGFDGEIQDPENIKYIGYMMYMLGCNPSAIINTIKGIFAVPLIAPGPRNAFNILLGGYVMPDLTGKESGILECLEFIRRIHRRHAQDTPRVLLLLGLSAPINSFTPSFFDYISSAINKFCPEGHLTAQDALDFVQSNFIGSTWIQEDRARVPDYTRGGQKFYRIHPILTNMLRFLLDQGQFHEQESFLLQGNSLSMERYGAWQHDMFVTFYQHLAYQTMNAFVGEEDALAESYFNTLNYFAALNSLSEDNSNITTNPDLVVFSLTIWLPITNILWKHAVESMAPTIPFDILLKHAETAIKLFSDRGDPGGAYYLTFSSICRRLCSHLYSFYVHKSPAWSRLFVISKLSISAATLCSQNSLDFVSATMISDDLWDLSNAYLSMRKRYASGKIALVAGLVLLRAAVETPDQKNQYYAHFAHTCQALFQASRQGDGTFNEHVIMPFRCLMERISREKSVPLPMWYGVVFRQPKQRILDNVDIGWARENDKVDRPNVVRAIDRSNLLLSARRINEAKACFVELLREALGSGDIAAQFACHRGLALLYCERKEWETAGRHAREAMRLLSDKENSRADWIPFSDREFDIMYLKFALILMELHDWPMAVHALCHVYDREGPRRHGWKLRQLSEFQTPVEFAEYARDPLAIGVAVLSLAPDFLISRDRVPELRRDFLDWIQQVSPIAWPDFDLTSINIETLATIVNVTELPDHPSSFELDDLLARYQASGMDSPTAASGMSQEERNDIGEKLQDAIWQVVSHFAGPHVKVVSEEEFSKGLADNETLLGGNSSTTITDDWQTTNTTTPAPPGSPRAASHDGNREEAGHQQNDGSSSSSRQQIWSSRGLLMSPSFFIKLARGIGVNEIKNLDVDLPADSFVNWELLVRTIRFYVRASSISPLGEDALLSQTIYRLLEALYDEEAIVSEAEALSNDAVVKVIEMVAGDLEERDIDEVQRNISEVEMMEDALRLLFPAFMEAEAQRAVRLYDPHEGLTLDALRL